MSLKDDCVCGHDRTQHYLHNDSKRYNCLAVHCECKRFREPAKDDPNPWSTGFQIKARPLDDDNGPETPRMHKPHASTSCRCQACLDWELARFRAWQ